MINQIYKMSNSLTTFRRQNPHQKIVPLEPSNIDKTMFSRNNF